MIKGKRVLAIIPARGGSKGIKNKNIIDVCGKPLIAYTIEAARQCTYIDEVFVSTDSGRIAEVSIEYGASVPFLRPSELATDESKTIDSVIFTVEALKASQKSFDILILLQPTSPLRTSEDINGAIEKFIRNDCISLAAVSLMKSSPILIRTIIDEQNMKGILDRNSTVRRQDMPNYYYVNGSIYINNICELSVNTSFNDNLQPYIMDAAHSVDIDDMEDIITAEKIILNGQ